MHSTPVDCVVNRTSAWSACPNGGVSAAAKDCDHRAPKRRQTMLARQAITCRDCKGEYEWGLAVSRASRSVRSRLRPQHFKEERSAQSRLLRKERAPSCRETALWINGHRERMRLCHKEDEALEKYQREAMVEVQRALPLRKIDHVSQTLRLSATPPAPSKVPGHSVRDQRSR